MRKSCPSLFAVVFACATLSAQTQPPAPAAVAQEEAIILSPFIVNTTLDEG